MTKQPTAAGVFASLAPVWPAADRERADATVVTARRATRALRAGGRVLDVGSGTGALLSAIRVESRDAGKVLGGTVGVDVVRAMAQRAGARRGVRAVVGDGLYLPFADQVFDVVVSSDVLPFFGDPGKAAREMFRVTLPGGTILAELPPPAPAHGRARRLAARLRKNSVMRRYLEMPRTFGFASFVATLEGLRCDVREIPGLPGAGTRFLRAVARLSPDPEDAAVARELADETTGTGRSLWVRLPGPRESAMPVVVTDLPGWTPERVRRLIADLPVARGYQLVVKPLRYRTRPHVQAFCEFDTRRIIVQVPMPFHPFSEDVPYRAQRVGAKGFNFRWYRRRLRFERPHELIRYLYLHEYYHWYVREVLGRRSAATETACDRFALQRL